MGEKILYAILVVAVSYLTYRILINIINKSFALKMKISKTNSNKRKQKTINVILNNIVKYTFGVAGAFTALGVLGVNASALVTSMGIVGIAIGLAVQDILKDIIAGIFILIEDQYVVGDTISVGLFKGEVIFLGLKSTKLRSETGEIKTIANHNIIDIVNYSSNDLTLFIDIDLNYDNDDALIEKVMTELATKLSKSVKNIKSDVKYIGIQKIADKITYRFSVQTGARRQEEIKRQIWNEIKKVLDKNNVRR